MKYSVTIALLALFSLSTANSMANLANAISDRTVLNYLMKGNELAASSDLQTTTECFNKYLPVLNEIASNFSTQYENCISVADQATTNLTAQAAQNKSSFIQQTTDICSAFQSCGNASDTLTSFNCFANASTTDVTVIYDLSSRASNAATTLSQGLQNIQAQRDQCTTGAEHYYVVQTSDTYDALNACFVDGLPSGSSTEATTTEASTVTTETSAASTTTAAA